MSASVTEAVETLFRRDVIGGIVPGVMVTTEVFLGILALRDGGEFGKTSQAVWSIFKEANFTSGTVLLLGIAATGWIVGWMVRKLGFVIMERRWIKRLATRVGSLPVNTKETMQLLKRQDAQAYRLAARSHEWWPVDPDEIEDSAPQLFHLAKQWLRQNDPHNAVLDKEATINALAGVGAGSLGVVVLSLWPSSLVLQVWVAVVALAVSILILTLGARERRFEELDVLRSFVYGCASSEQSIHPRRVPWAQFESMFKDSMRVELDWEAAAGLPVWLEEHEKVPPDWYTVWYTVGTTLSSFRDPKARPMTVSNATGCTLEKLLIRHRPLLRKLKEGYQGGGGVELWLPVWRTSEGRTIILDGNHRAVAAVLSKAQVRVHAYVVRGPADPAIMPDLSHHRSSRSGA